MPSVYVESTIPSFYHESRTDRVILTWRDFTRQWWDEHRTRFELFTSRFVLRELNNTPGIKSAACIRMLADVEVLDEPDGLGDVIEYYVEHKLMPRDALGDAAHLAMASMHNLDFLVTWNCQHLANANKAKHIGIVNGRLGLSTPIITTPVMLLPKDEH